MPDSRKSTFQSIHGIKIPYADHNPLRKLKRNFRPWNHGHKIWPASWMLIDYIRKTKAIYGRRVLDLGCGWGIAGIYCARKQKASVAGVDMDPDVRPYLDLMAAMNGVNIDFFNLEIGQIRKKMLARFDVVIGADICFCDSMIDPLRKLFLRAKAASVKHVLLSDPNRWPFEELSTHFIRTAGAVVEDWEIKKPQDFSGKILRIDF